MSKYRQPIIYLPMVWKILTTQVREKNVSRLKATDYFLENKKDVGKKEELQIFFCIETNVL